MKHTNIFITIILFFTIIANLEAQEKVLSTNLGHLDWVKSVVFSPDGKYVASGNYDNTIKLWNHETGQVIRTFYGHNNRIESVAFSPDGKRIISGGASGSMKLWNVETGKKINNLEGHSGNIRCVTFSPDGKYIASCSSDNNIILRNAENGDIMKTFDEHRGGVYSIAFSPDSKNIASCGPDKTVKIRDIEVGERVKTFGRNAACLYSIAFSPDGKYIVSGSEDKIVKIIGTETGKSTKTFTGHTDIVTMVAFSPDGKYIASGSWDGTIKVINAVTAENLKTLVGHTDDVQSVAFSPNSKYIVSGSSDGTIKLWDIEAGEEIRTFVGNGGLVKSVIFSFNYDETSDTTELRNENMQEIKIFQGDTLSNTSIAFGPNNKYIASSGWDNNITLRSIKSGDEIRTFIGHSGLIKSIAFSPSGERIASGGWDKKIKLWDTRTGYDIKNIHLHTKTVNYLTFSPDGKYIASGSSDKTIKFSDVKTGKEIKTLEGHESDVESLAFNSDGKYIVSGSRNSIIKLWNTETGEEIKTFTGDKNSVERVAFSPDENYIISGNTDGTINFWEIQTGKLVGTFGNIRNSEDWFFYTPDGKYTGVNCDKYLQYTVGKQIYSLPKDDRNFLPQKLFGERVRLTFEQKISKYVNEKISVWQKQKEKEKDILYKKRINKQRNKMLQTYANQIIDSLEKDFVKTVKWEEREISEYDTEKKTFTIKVPETDDIILNVPVNVASKFKENWPNIKADKIDYYLNNNNFYLASVSFLYNKKRYKYVNKNIKPYAVKTEKYKFEPFIVYALIIGNENYIKLKTNVDSTSDVSYAKNNALTFKDYLVKTVGVTNNHIITRIDGQSLQIGKDINKFVALQKLNPKANFIFYYSGLGFSDTTNNSYLIPADVDSANIMKRSIKLNDLYKKITKNNVRRTTVFLDADFNNLHENKPDTEKVNNASLSGNIVVFSASSGKEKSFSHNAEKQGIFTYNLLKILNENENDIKYGKLAEKLKNEVSNMSIEKNDKKQEPQILISPEVTEIWKNWEWKK